MISVFEIARCNSTSSNMHKVFIFKARILANYKFSVMQINSYYGLFWSNDLLHIKQCIEDI